MFASTRACLAVGAAALCTVMLLAGCTGSGSGATPSPSGPRVRVAVSTSAYGALVREVGGAAVEISTLSSSPLSGGRQPTLAASGASAVADAQVVVENGAGYDSFVDTLMTAHPNTSRIVVNAATLAASRSASRSSSAEVGTPSVPYVAYDVPTMRLMVGALVGALSQSDPADASTFVGNGETVTTALNTLARDERGLRGKVHGKKVAMTDAVAAPMLTAVGLSGSIVTAGGSLSGLTALIRDEQVPSTAGLASAARKAGVKVAEIRETPPAGRDYVEWMTDELNAIASATT